jgi:hypothetical protein
MPSGEKDNIFSSKVKYTGIFNFADFYKFCYDWIQDELEFPEIVEEKYSEKISGEAKGIEIEWVCAKKATDYFKFEIKCSFRILNMTEVEVTKNGTKTKMNKGILEMKVKGTLMKDYQGKFDKSAFKKFLRGIYEKWVITSRINEFEDKLAGYCDELLNQAKAFLDLEGKK